MGKETITVRMTFDTEDGELLEVNLLEPGEQARSRRVGHGKAQSSLDLEMFYQEQRGAHRLRPHTFFFAHGSPG